MACTCLVTSWILCRETKNNFTKNELPINNVEIEDHERRLQLKYDHLTNGISCSVVIAEEMYQNKKLTAKELHDIQALEKTPIRANEELLNIVMRKPRNVYECFLETLKNNRQQHLYDLLETEDQNIKEFHSDLIRRYYTLLIDDMISNYVLIGHLYESNVLTRREMEQLDTEKNGYKKNQLLLSIISRKSRNDFQTFKSALRASGQNHIADEIEIKTSKESPAKIGQILRFPGDQLPTESTPNESKETILKRRELLTMEMKFKELDDEMQKEISIKVTSILPKTTNQLDDILNTCLRKTLEESVQIRKELAKKEKEIENKDTMMRNEFENIRTVATNALTTAAFDTNYRLKADLDLIIEKIEINNSLQKNIKQEVDMKTNVSIEKYERLQAEQNKTRKELEETLSILKKQEGNLNLVKRKNNKLVKDNAEEKELRSVNDINIKKLTKDLQEQLLMLKITEETLKKSQEENYLLKKDMKELNKKEGSFDYRVDPILIQTITTTTDKHIRGVTILNKELFLVKGVSSDVEVYDSMSLSFNRSCKLEDLNDAWDIVSSERDNCLYISNFKETASDQQYEILNIDPNGKMLKKWPIEIDGSVGSRSLPYACNLSVTRESNVIATLNRSNKLIEYSQNGQMIRRINLLTSAGIDGPQHVLKLTNDNFLVCHGRPYDNLHRVCLVDVDGNVIRSFGGKKGSNENQVNCPFYLAVDEDGSIMVVDYVNIRVLLLSSNLEFKREIISQKKHRINRPYKLCLDPSNQLLFVVIDTCELLVYNIAN